MQLPAWPPPPTPPDGPTLIELLAGASAQSRLWYESSQDLCQAVTAASGIAVTPAIGLDTTQPGPPPDPARGHRNWLSASPYEMLHAVGETIRSTMVLPKPLSWFSGHWAVVGYLWSFRPNGPDLRFSSYARALRGRALGLWTEAMAVGVATLFVQRSLGGGGAATQLIDIDSAWFRWLRQTGLVTHPGTGPRPDYVVGRWDATGALEMVAIECKGSTAARLGGKQNLAGGVPQVLSVGAGMVPLRHWVVGAACATNAAGIWHPQVVEVDGGHGVAATPQDPSVTRAVERMASTRLLEATGDIELARQVSDSRKSKHPRRDDEAMDSQPDDRGRNYRGRTLQMRLGHHLLEVFLGIDATLREALANDAIDDATGIRRARALEVSTRRDGPSTGYATIEQDATGGASISAQGTLMRIRLIDS